MKKKSPPQKTTKSSIKKGTTVKTTISKRDPKSGKIKVTATKGEVRAAGDKVMKKYSVAIKKLADR